MASQIDRNVERANSNSSLDEKFQADDQIEDVEGTRRGPKNIDEGFDPAVVKKLIRRCDWRVVPILSAMYYVSLVDRTNLSLARQANNEQMNADLNLGGTNNHYSIVTLIFFVPYIVFEIPVSEPTIHHELTNSLKLASVSSALGGGSVQLSSLGAVSCLVWPSSRPGSRWLRAASSSVCLNRLSSLVQCTSSRAGILGDRWPCAWSSSTRLPPLHRPSPTLWAIS